MRAVMYTNDIVRGGRCKTVMGIIGPVLVQQWRHCNDCMHCCLSFMQNWQRLTPNGPNHPMVRSGPAVVSLTAQLDSQRTLLTFGGYPNYDSWQCDMHTVKWIRVGFVFEKVVTQALTP